MLCQHSQLDMVKALGGDADAFGEIVENVADRDHADQFLLGQNRDVAIAADVHLVQGKRDLVSGIERDRVGDHQALDWLFDLRRLVLGGRISCSVSNAEFSPLFSNSDLGIRT